MSALVMVCKSDRVELLCDAALYDPIGGTVGAIHSKLAPLPELNCVMSGRGPIPVMWITAYVASLSAKSFDEVVANFEAIRAQAATYNNGDVPAEEWDRADIGFIGWSKSRSRPEAYMSLGKGSPDSDVAPGSLSPCDVGVFAGASVAVVRCASGDSSLGNSFAISGLVARCWCRILRCSASAISAWVDAISLAFRNSAATRIMDATIPITPTISSISRQCLLVIE